MSRSGLDPTTKTNTVTKLKSRVDQAIDQACETEVRIHDTPKHRRIIASPPGVYRLLTDASVQRCIQDHAATNKNRIARATHHNIKTTKISRTPSRQHSHVTAQLHCRPWIWSHWDRRPSPHALEDSPNCRNAANSAAYQQSHQNGPKASFR